MRQTIPREEYIKMLSNILTVKIDFAKLNYAELMSRAGHKEYLRLDLITGECITFDVTDFTNEKIFHILAMLEMGKVPSCRVTDTETLIRIARRLNA